MNSHLLGEVEATCDRVAFIKAGRVLRTLGLHDLEMGLLHVELRVDAAHARLDRALCNPSVISFHMLEGEHHASCATAPRCSTAITGSDSSLSLPVMAAQLLVAEADGSTVTLELTLTDEELLPVIAERTLASGARLYALTPRHLSLEQLFLDVVGTEDSGQ